MLMMPAVVTCTIPAGATSPPLFLTAMIGKNWFAAGRIAAGKAVLLASTVELVPVVARQIGKFRNTNLSTMKCVIVREPVDPPEPSHVNVLEVVPMAAILTESFAAPVRRVM